MVDEPSAFLFHANVKQMKQVKQNFILKTCKANIYKK